MRFSSPSEISGTVAIFSGVEIRRHARTAFSRALISAGALPAPISAFSISAALSGMRSAKPSPTLTLERINDALAKEFTASPLS